MAFCIRRAVVVGICALHAALGQTYTKLYRPQYHFIPKENWMNNPNGLLYYNGTYHMYYQYNPGGTTWGALSWGPATSRDLTHWQHQPIAPLARGYPNNITEMFFSGSVVADIRNTSGFGTYEEVPLVAMYTSYYPMAQTVPSGKTIREGQQSQSIAYSLDEGMTWTTYKAGNPVILEPPESHGDQYRDFRDPYVFWHDSTKKWIAVVSLAQLHKLLIYTSLDLKVWTYVSEFGPVNAVGGVWECPSIFPLPLDGDEANMKWVAQIGLNPGGPLGVIGSGTQYVVGSFDGTTFIGDTNNIYSAPILLNGSVIFQDFEGHGSFADLSWTATGDLIGTGPANGTLAGQQTVTGYLGNRLLTTFLNEDSTTGTITSPSFRISHMYINFLIGGGYAPNTTCINLKIRGQMVRTATGLNEEKLSWYGWDVSGWGHISVDAISFSNTLARTQEANWVDWGPDFYAALTFNGLPFADRIDIAWMNNWQYGAAIPTSPWRSAMSVPRKLSLKTVNGKATLVQQPAEDWVPLESSGNYSCSWDVVQKAT